MLLLQINTYLSKNLGCLDEIESSRMSDHSRLEISMSYAYLKMIHKNLIQKGKGAIPNTAKRHFSSDADE